MPGSIIQSNTLLLPKNSDTHIEKNYRTIAFLNTTDKLYTGIIKHFMQGHCTTNGIITTEQAGGKKGSWGCPDQLNRRNLFTMWFDYRKAFDSISHHWWLFEALRLATLPEGIISNIRALAEKWTTKVFLKTHESATVTDFIKYLTGVLQGNCFH